MSRKYVSTEVVFEIIKILSENNNHNNITRLKARICATDNSQQSAEKVN